MFANRKADICIKLSALVCASTLLISADAAKENSKVTTLGYNEISTYELSTNRYTHLDSEKKAENLLKTEDHELVLQNDNLELWFSEETASVRIVNKKSGYIWGGVGEDPEDLNRRWSQVAQSLFTIEYYDAELNSKRVAVSDSSVIAEYEYTDDGFTCKADFTEQGISLEVKVELEDAGISIEAPWQSIDEYGEAKLYALYFVPFLGTSHGDDVPGYMFVPDGSGALIRFREPRKYATMYNAKIFGNDPGLDVLNEANELLANRPNDYLVENRSATLPVYGVVHGVRQNAYLAEVQSGAEYSRITAYPAGVTTDYNWVSARFEYRSIYTYSTGRDGSGFQNLQQEKNQFNAKLKIWFLNGDDADYSGMAVKYRNELISRGVLNQERKDMNIPLRLDIAGSEVYKGLFLGQRKLTTAKQAEEIAQKLLKENITNLTMVYKGWQNKGISGAYVTQTAFSSGLGGTKAFKTLKESLESSGGRLYLAINASTANKSQLNLSTHAVRTISQKFASKTRQNSNVLYSETYYIRPQKQKEILNNASKKLEGFNLYLDNLGTTLSSDFTRGKATDRINSASLIKNAVSEMDRQLSMSNVNLGLLEFTNEYFDAPSSNSQYLFETDSVPFLQMVLKGSVDYYAEYANMGFYSDIALLKMAEYGMYPSFFVMAADNSKLKDTPLEDYYSLAFSDWFDVISKSYKFLNKILSKTEGAKIIQHRVLDKGLVKIKYDNGIDIYINYFGENKQIDNITFPGKSAAVKEGSHEIEFIRP